MKIILSLVVFLASFPLAALDNPSFYQIENIFVWSDGSVQVWLEGPVDHGCGGSFNNRFIMEVEEPSFDAKFSLLLASKLSGTPVKLGYECSGSVALINKVRS